MKSIKKATNLLEQTGSSDFHHVHIKHKLTSNGANSQDKELSRNQYLHELHLSQSGPFHMLRVCRRDF